MIVNIIREACSRNCATWRISAISCGIIWPIMSDFKLDIDYPVEIVKKESLEVKPDRIPYSPNAHFVSVITDGLFEQGLD